MQKGNLLIEFNLYALAYYSEAEYNETIFITPQDYIKYFGSGQDTDDKTFEEYVKNQWDGREIYVGELDGKHSEVYGNVEVDFWDAERIAEYWEQPDNDGDNLLDELADSAVGGNLSYKDKQKFIDDIKLHVNEVIESIGTKVTVECRVPKNKVDELKAFVKQLNK